MNDKKFFQITSGRDKIDLYFIEAKDKSDAKRIFYLKFPGESIISIEEVEE